MLSDRKKTLEHKGNRRYGEFDSPEEFEIDLRRQREAIKAIESFRDNDPELKKLVSDLNERVELRLKQEQKLDITFYPQEAESDSDDEDTEHAEAFLEEYRHKFKLIGQAFEKTFENTLGNKSISPRFFPVSSLFDSDSAISGAELERKNEFPTSERLQAALTKTKNFIKPLHEKLSSKIKNDLDFISYCKHAKNAAQHMRAMTEQMKKLVKSKPLSESDDHSVYAGVLIFVKETFLVLQLAHDVMKKYVKLKEEVEKNEEVSGIKAKL